MDQELPCQEIRDACEYLIARAEPAFSKEKCGKCATLVRQAFSYGFKKNIAHELSAKNYGSIYEKNGFKRFANQDDKDYSPQLGDICIIQYEPHGHICVYTQQGWISDFKQKDMYGGSIRNKKPNFDIYRW